MTTTSSSVPDTTPTSSPGTSVPPGGELPRTGGTGTGTFLVIGTLLLAGGAALILVSRWPRSVGG
jgi:LPXTG-motif cell wall-anchored protein